MPFFLYSLYSMSFSVFGVYTEYDPQFPIIVIGFPSVWQVTLQISFFEVVLYWCPDSNVGLHLNRLREQAFSFVQLHNNIYITSLVALLVRGGLKANAHIYSAKKDGPVVGGSATGV